MLPSFVLSLREGLEAALIIGIVLGALHKIHRTDLRPLVWQGAGVAILVSLLAGFGLTLLGAEFEGRGEYIFEGVTMVLAALLLTWMIFWVSRQNRHLSQTLDTGVRRAALQSSNSALFLLAFFAVVREGIELAVFLFAARLATDGLQTVVGATLGLVSAILLGWLFFHSATRLNLRHFFRVSNVLLMFFAAGLVAHGAHEFIEAGLLPAGIANLWDLNFLLDENSFLGQLAAVLFGYNANPTLTEVVVYLGYFIVLGIAARLTLTPKSPQRADTA
jgi:high-affinity iron transporter